MPKASYHFPQGFLWGTATAAHQVEGSNTNNNWSAWEKEPGRIQLGHQAGMACDWWGGRWREDLDRAVESGQNAHRLSVEWSRIQPKPDVWDEDAMEFYRQMLRGMLERKLTPMVTLHHFSDPSWLTERGGWENEDTPIIFQAFVKKVVNALKEYASLWVTINEPNVYMLCGYIDGVFPPGKKDLNSAYLVMRNMVRGHAAAYHALHELQPQAQVGTALHYQSIHPARQWLPFDRWLANFIRKNMFYSFPDALVDGKFRFLNKKESIPAAANTLDYFGLNYYTRTLVNFQLTAYKNLFYRLSFPPGAEVSETNHMANAPDGFFEALHWAKSYQQPVIVTENGIEDKSDKLRPSYLFEHIHQIWRAVNFNWPVKGYFHWTLVDNFEWERGWTQRFGLWGLDVDTQARIRRDSVDAYAAICNENGITSDMVQTYAPQAFERLFPS